MALLLTIDASVFVAACQPNETGHPASLALLKAMLDADVLLMEPAILPVEVGAALCRAGKDAASAREFAESILALPCMTLLTVDERLAQVSRFAS